MSTTSGQPGWYPDPSGVHELRYYNDGWTEHVSDHGVQAVSPLPPPPPAPVPVPTQPVPAAVATVADSGPPSGRRRVTWVVGGLALVVVAVVAVVAATSGSSDDGDAAGGPGQADSGVDQAQSFCDDFSGTWSIVLGGMIDAETLMYSADTDPAFSGGTSDQLNSVTQGAQDASVIAAEAPDELKDQVTAMSDFLGLALQLVQGDTSVVGEMTGLNISSEDAAYLLGSVPLQQCATP